MVPWIEPITNKLGAIFADPRIREIFSSPKSTFNLREAMDEGKVVLIKLDKGRLKDAANLLGALLVAKIQMAAFSRSDVPEKKRRPFYLTIDEFQNFANDSFATILSESRKYGLYVTMAHQTLAQIPGELKNLILSCAGIQVYFRLSREDASLLAKEAFQYGGNWEEGISGLQNLPLRVCFVKNKMHGGLIHINTVSIDDPWNLVEMGEDEFREALDKLPFGRKYLIPRKGIEERRMIQPQESKVQRELPKPPKLPEVKPAPQPVQAPVEAIEKETPPEDKEGSRHQYLQGLIKRMAEEKGWKATIEEPIPDGRVDVGLLKDGKRIAIEISVTNTPEHEVENISKCLKAGYVQVISCSKDKKHLEKIRALVGERFPQADQGKVNFFEPEELLFFLEEESAKGSGKEDRVKGYKVKVKYTPLSASDKTRKREAVAQVIMGAFKRLKGKE